MVKKAVKKPAPKAKAPVRKAAPAKKAVKPKATVKPKAKPVAPVVVATAEPAKGSSALSYQQQMFVTEYIKDRNGTQAAIRAGYSEKGAATQAERMLRKAEIRAEIDQFITKTAESAGIGIERTLKEVARLAFFDPRKLLNPDGSPIPIQELDDDTAACVAGLDILEEFEGTGKDRVFVGYTKKYKFADKNSALDKAMKHHGLYKKDNEQGGEAAVNALTRLLQGMAKSSLPVVADPTP